MVMKIVCSMQPKATTSLPAVLPTHVEIVRSVGNHTNLSAPAPQLSDDGSRSHAVSDSHNQSKCTVYEGVILLISMYYIQCTC